MNCIEVGELMQLKIDEELNDSDTVKLETHLENCISCQQLYKRLQLLSTQLEQLPHVTPSFSIVDSILPQLNEIDKQSRMMKLIEQEEAASLISKVEHKKTDSRFRWMTIATSGLVAAAAIVLTVNLSKEQLSSNSADNFDTANVSTVDSTAQGDVAVSSRALNEVDVQQRDSMMVTEIEDQSGALINEPLTSSVDQLKSNVTNNASGEHSPSQEATITSEEIEKEQSNELFTTSSDHKETNNTSEISDTDSVSSTPFGVRMSNEQAIGELVSPNQSFYLVLHEHSITIYDYASDKSYKTIDVPIKGELHFIGWHEESIEFYVDVVDDQLQTHRLTFNMGE